MLESENDDRFEREVMGLTECCVGEIRVYYEGREEHWVLGHTCGAL